MGDTLEHGGARSSDAEVYAQQLALFHPLRKSVIRSAIKALLLAPASRGLDTGCGIGQVTLMLAEAVGPEGHCTGLDLSAPFVARAREISRKSPLSGQVSFQQGNVHALPFDDHRFDWVWSSDCVGYPAREPVALLKELSRVVKPEGTVAILIWSSQQLLPGYPLLEARLNATAAGMAPFTGGMGPELHALRALGWFRDAGLEEALVHTFVGTVHGPLSDGTRSALISLFDMRWKEARPEMAPEDWAQYERLCQPGSPDFILDLPDYYAFFTYSLFRGQVGRSTEGQKNLEIDHG
ncbi:MAG: class I SAM-dependent methyltransferase [Thermodesulfobacteriota bacterium]|nr:class I SAM-dependent methyltransferase [Thermodesulfobacteriota bacterium]